MLFETLFQFEIFLSVFYFGLVAGIFYIIKKILSVNSVLTVVLDIAFMIIAFLLFMLSINLFNYGEVRLYLVLSFVLGFVILNKTIGNLVESFLKISYTNLQGLVNKLRGKNNNEREL